MNSAAVLIRLITVLATCMAFATLAVGATACGTPCKDLSDQVCNCEPTENDQRACLQRVESDAATLPVSDEQEEFCASIIDSGSCTCDALADGELAACGLAEN